MLVLTRKLGEKIKIGDNISITIVELDGRYVKLGIDAPRSVIVHREEVFQRIQDENKRAAAPAQGADLASMANLLKKKSEG